MLIKDLHTQIKAIKPKDNCPNCGIALNPLPKRKSNCKSCKQPIFVRYSIPHKKTIFANAKQIALLNKFSTLYDQVNSSHAPFLGDDGFVFRTSQVATDKMTALDGDRAWGMMIFGSAKAMVQQDWLALLYYKWQEFFLLFKECRFLDAQLRIPAILALSRICGTPFAEQRIDYDYYKTMLEHNIQTVLSVVNVWAIYAVFEDHNALGEYLFDCQDSYFLQTLHFTNQTCPDVFMWFFEQSNKFNLSAMPSITLESR